MTPRRPRQTRPAQRGAALLMAMITVALVATIAAAALWRQWRGIAVESAERTRVQSAWLLTGALDWARILLQGDLQEDVQHNRIVDHLGEPWAVPLAESRLSDFLSTGQASGADLDRNAFLSGQITDLQSRLNVMNLAAPSPGTRDAARRPFTRLFQALGLPASQLDALQRNLIAAQAAIYPGQISGAGNTGGDAPLLPQRVEQLVWLGLDNTTLARLAPYVTVLPLPPGLNSTIPVNLNTASSVVIQAALPGATTGQPGIDLADAERLVTLRQSNYFTSVDDAMKRLGKDTSSIDTSWVDVKSSFFQVRGQLRLDDATLQELAAVQRIYPPARAFPLWRDRSAFSVY